MPDEEEGQVLQPDEGVDNTEEVVEETEAEDVVLTKPQLEALLAESSAKTEKRFKDTQAALTKSQQENADIRKRLAQIDAEKPKQSNLLWDEIVESGETKELRDAYTTALLDEREAARKKPEPELTDEAVQWNSDREAFVSSNPKADLSALDKHFEKKRLSHADFYTIYQIQTGQVKVVPVGAERKPVTTLPKGGGNPPANPPKPGNNYDSVEAEIRKNLHR